ncbi:hypothetical protein [Mycoplasma miroungirhinis]|uniref:Uncharacterized protein n=1 Tax=Mycoplasma miroungirhinis TaxID=754516 RepID=A0A6M4JDG1_9MOLU|nr:hypothetical protein [Mycoplasma miroungirhinis]QJR44288.1 hypothetical protein HLA92_02490 [Mycoplasma miroungirhinis]
MEKTITQDKDILQNIQTARKLTIARLVIGVSFFIIVFALLIAYIASIASFAASTRDPFYVGVGYVTSTLALYGAFIGLWITSAIVLAIIEIIILVLIPNIYNTTLLNIKIGKIVGIFIPFVGFAFNIIFLVKYKSTLTRNVYTQ